MVAFLFRTLVMVLLLATGSLWLRPADPARLDPGVWFEEIAQRAGCSNHHTMVELSPRFANIMPWLSSVGAAVAAADYDGDGWTDLYCTNSGPGSSNRLFRNRGDGTFEEVAARAGVACGNREGACMHAVFGDVDNDGDLDLYVTKWAAPNQMFLNQGDGTFVDASVRARVDSWGYGNAATYLDYDRDGRLDLLVGNYFADSLPDPRTGKRARSDLWNPVTTRVMHSTFTHADNGGGTKLYHNLGDGRFEEVGWASGLRFKGWTLAVGAADLNNDGWPDLYVANDFGPDELYFNTGAAERPPRFRRVIDATGHPGIGNDWWKGMNVDFGDVDGNGFLDIYVTNILAPRYKTDEGNMLWLNVADPAGKDGRRFWNAAQEAAVNDGGWGWGAKFLDANNDGLLDIFALNGFVTGNRDHTYWYALQEMVTQTKNNAADAADWPEMGDRDLSGHEPSRLFVQIPTERGARTSAWKAPRFIDVAARAGITDADNGRGVAAFDLENDGAVDLCVANQGAASLLYHNRPDTTSREQHWLGLRLVGRPDLPRRVGARSLGSTTAAVGARVELEAGGMRQLREVSGGTGFASQSDSRLHFGLGSHAPSGLKVFWPSGREQSFEGPELAACLDRYTLLVEGAGLESLVGPGRPVVVARTGAR